MTKRRHKRADREHAEPSIALNAVCPYYTMFPLSFPISVLKRFGERKLRVADPFCGRGTTIFAARLKGHQAYGIDASPIAIPWPPLEASDPKTLYPQLAQTIEPEGLEFADFHCPETGVFGPRMMLVDPKSPFPEFAALTND